MAYKIPKISIQYAWGYDEYFNTALKIKYKRKIFSKRAKRFLENLRTYFNEENEARVLKLISKYSGIKWKCDQIIVYLVNNLVTRGFSRPMTLKIEKDCLFACTVFVHELVHFNLYQDMKKSMEVFGIEKDFYVIKKIYKSKHYKKVYDIMEKIYPKLGNNVLKSLMELSIN